MFPHFVIADLSCKATAKRSKAISGPNGVWSGGRLVTGGIHERTAVLSDVYQGEMLCDT